MKRLNRDHRVECPRCGIKLYTQIALTKHLMRVHGYIPPLTKREQAAAQAGEVHADHRAVSKGGDNGG